MYCVLPGTLAEDEVAPVCAQVRETIEKQGATAVIAQDMGKSRLAYPVKQIRYGYFHLFYFDAEPNILIDLERKVRIIQNVLRVIIRSAHPDAGKIPTQFNINWELPVKEEYQRVDMPEYAMQHTGAPMAPAAVMSAPAPEVQIDVQPVKKEFKSVTIEDIDKKLDEILGGELDKI